MRPLSAEIKHNYILHTFPKKNSSVRILTINSVIASYHNRDYQDQQNARNSFPNCSQAEQNADQAAARSI